MDMQIQECKGSRKREGEQDREGFTAMTKSILVKYVENQESQYVENQSSLDVDMPFYIRFFQCHSLFTDYGVGVRKGLHVS
jgi:hypothetical protein